VDPTREALNNGTVSGPLPVCNGFSGESPLKSCSDQANDDEEKAEPLDRR
jgi:hypothetical protein